MEKGGIHLGPSPELESYRHKHWPRFLFRWKQLAFPRIQSNVKGLPPARSVICLGSPGLEVSICSALGSWFFRGKYHFHNNCYSFSFPAYSLGSSYLLWRHPQSVLNPFSVTSFGSVNGAMAQAVLTLLDTMYHFLLVCGILAVDSTQLLTS